VSNTVLSIDSVSVHYGQMPAISNVSLKVTEGEYLGIIGPNGSGKSTLLKAILGLIPVSSGSIRVYGQKPGKSKEMIGYVPQFASFDKRFPITLFEVVLTGRLKVGLSPFYCYSQEDKTAAHCLIEKFGLSNLSSRRISDLSGGEFQKMLIARALALNPRLLLLDEPTASVDAASREQIFELLAQLNKSMTIILVTHDMLAISSQVTSLACLNGHLVYHGEPELTETIVNNLYGCPVDLIAHGVPHRVLKEHGEDNNND
jgi:zinc transport system ATP-binding protein